MLEYKNLKLVVFIINEQENYRKFMTEKKTLTNIKANCDNIIFNET